MAKKVRPALSPASPSSPVSSPPHPCPRHWPATSSLPIEPNLLETLHQETLHILLRMTPNDVGLEGAQALIDLGITMPHSWIDGNLVDLGLALLPTIFQNSGTTQKTLQPLMTSYLEELFYHSFFREPQLMAGLCCRLAATQLLVSSCKASEPLQSPIS